MQTNQRSCLSITSQRCEPASFKTAVRFEPVFVSHPTQSERFSGCDHIHYNDFSIRVETNFCFVCRAVNRGERRRINCPQTVAGHLDQFLTCREKSVSTQNSTDSQGSILFLFLFAHAADNKTLVNDVGGTCTTGKKWTNINTTY